MINIAPYKTIENSSWIKICKYFIIHCGKILNLNLMSQNILFNKSLELPHI